MRHHSPHPHLKPSQFQTLKDFFHTHNLREHGHVLQNSLSLQDFNCGWKIVSYGTIRQDAGVKVFTLIFH